MIFTNNLSTAFRPIFLRHKSKLKLRKAASTTYPPKSCP
jgi:porphobilinogen deaminase